MRKRRAGFSLIELMIVIAIISALAAIVTVSSNAILKQSRETAALAQVQTSQKAQTQHYSMKRRHAGSLKDLGDLIPAHLASGKLGGYLYEMTGSEDGFVIHADPERRGRTGDTSFYSDDTLVIRRNGQAVADRESPPVQ
jgi:prepilin-type N-terminal cleavage/methylation domain-containing protein